MQDKVPETGLTRWQEARAATASLLTSSLHAGDSLTILPFDSVVHAPLSYPKFRADQIPNLGQHIPDATTAGESGTNMRMAHDHALRILNWNGPLSAGPRPWCAIIVVSDGYNDAPPLHSAAWYDYANYCEVHKGNENLYPNTPQCIQWRRQARQFEVDGNETFGIGVKINDGVPEYRPPGEASSAVETDDSENRSISGTTYGGDRPAGGAQVDAYDSSGAAVDAATSDSDGHFVLKGLPSGVFTLRATQGGKTAEAQGIQPGMNGVNLYMSHNLLLLWIALVVLVLIALFASASIARSRRVSKVRVQVKDTGGRSRTFWLGGGTRVGLGGKDAPGIFPLEVFPAPAAYLRHTASGFSLVTEKGIEAESGGRKFTGAGPVAENSQILLSDSSGNKAAFEFRDISGRTRAAAATTAPAAGSDAYTQLDSSLKG
jgi:hypothetical protein